MIKTIVRIFLLFYSILNGLNLGTFRTNLKLLQVTIESVIKDEVKPVGALVSGGRLSSVEN